MYDLQCRDWKNTYYMLNGFPKVSSEVKCTNEKMTWNIQDTNLNWCVPKANVDHTINGQGTAISTLDNLATMPSAKYSQNCSFEEGANIQYPVLLRILFFEK